MAEPIRVTLHVRDIPSVPLSVDSDSDASLALVPDILPKIIQAVSPTVTLEETEEGVLMTVFDKNHTETALIPKGEKGDTGEAGPQGIQGEKGETGEAGPKGDKGDRGNTGPQGIQGEKGDTGATGPQGIQGAKGDKGETGPQGIQGPKGDTGAKGDKGDKGDPGVKGDKGDVGPQGPKGDTGATGPQGPKGDKGDTGETGSQGPKGDKGDTGATGPQGIQGEKGEQGDDYVLTQQDKLDIAGMVSIPVTDVQIDGSSIIQNGIANVPIASYNDAGVVKVSNTFGIILGSSGANAQYIRTYPSTDANIKAGNEYYRPITSDRQHKSVFYGLAKAAGDSTQSASDNPVGTYTDEAKEAICKMLGAASEEQLRSVEIKETVSTPSAVMTITDGADDIPVDELVVGIEPVQSGSGDPAPDNVRPISGWAGASIYYSGADTTDPETIAVSFPTEVGTVYGGTLTVHKDGTGTLVVDRAMVVMDGDTKKVTVAGSGTENWYYKCTTGIPRLSGHNEQLISSNYPYAGIGNTNTVQGVTVTGTGDVRIRWGAEQTAEAYNTWLQSNPLTVLFPMATPETYELTALDVIETLKGTNNIWSDTGDIQSLTYSADPKLYVDQHSVSDVQVNGTSILSHGVANVPIASSSDLGVVKTLSDRGTTATNNGIVSVYPATDANIKAGSQDYRPIVPSKQNQSVFYGLAKAAGDSTQSASSNAVGTYTDDAKTAIRAMLGLDDQSIVDIVEAGLPAAEGVTW